MQGGPYSPRSLHKHHFRLVGLCWSCDKPLFLQALFKLEPFPVKADLRPCLESNNSCNTDLTGTRALGSFTHISKTEVASSPVFLPAQMSNHRRVRFLGTSQKLLRALKAFFQHFRGIFSENCYFSEKMKEMFLEKTEHAKRNPNATLIKSCLEDC